MAYGADVADIITLNLGAGAFSTMVKLSLCLALIFTFPIQLFPATVHQ
jgi:hypothetical protein